MVEWLDPAFYKARKNLWDKHEKTERVEIDGDIISYAPDVLGRIGMYIADQALTPEHNYFEVEVLDSGLECNIVVGLVSYKHPLDQFPGSVDYSIGFHLGDGSLRTKAPKEPKPKVFGPKCEAGDHIGVGITKSSPNCWDCWDVFFTCNGKEFGKSSCSNPFKALYPAVGFHSLGEEVRLSLGLQWQPEEDMSMCIDSNEDEWARLHDIHIDGSVLEYAGRGKSIIDVGLAQAKFPLDTTHHYFEIEILDPGKNCYIAIGLARKDYPKYRHPGWNKGSVAYHADDGKIFVGSGVGDPFGPRCYKGDVMGCGIIFPRDFAFIFGELDPSENNGQDLEDELSGSYSESEEEEWCEWLNEKENVETGMAVQVFFTRNGKKVGQKDVCIPKGGFYPTVGMLSSSERVKVDLHPLTG